ncbi:MAG: mucoidy inhibitor MuiA family protein [Myxococcaceae bacterium]
MLPIVNVTVMEDRAQVERRGAVQVNGLTRLEVDGVSLVAVDRSLKLEVKGATLVDAKLVRRWKEQPAGGLPENATELQKKVRSLEQARVAQADAIAQLEGRASLLEAARMDLLRSIAQLTGHGAPDVAQWKLQLAALSTRQAELDRDLAAARAELGQIDVRLGEARHASASEEPKKRFECFLALTLDGAGEALVKASYLVPCAVWRPAYRATLSGEQVQVEAEAVVWQRTGEDWRDVELAFSTARPTLGTEPPTLTDDWLTSRPKSTQEKRVVDVAIREEVIQSAGESGGEAEMPGLDDGGEARLLKATGKLTVPSDGQPHRVGLFSFASKAVVERVCPAELTSLVFVSTKFPNGSGQVLLAGPVDLIRGSGLVGRAQLKFAAPGETVKLSFGNEDGVQVIRDTHEEVDEARLTGRRTTKKKVQLHVSNARPEATKLIIEERIPVSEVKEVEVQVLTKDCSPAPSVVTRDGIARLEVELAANATKTAKFTWELSAAGKVAGV